MKTLTLIVALALSPLALIAQTQNVQQDIPTKRLKSDIAIPSGKTITVESGASLVVSSGASTTGLLSSASLAGLNSGVATVTSGTGEIGSFNTSAGLAGAIGDETGTGSVAFSNSPVFVAPTLGVAAATSLTFPEASAPATPASATVILYAKADGLLYSKDDAGTETVVTGGSGGGGGSGDVVGPSSSTDEAIARFDSTTGKLLQGSVATLSDTGAFTVPEISAPSTPASGKVVFYAKSDGLLYSKDDAGTETVVTGGGGGGGGLGGSTGSTDNLILRADGTGGSTVQASTVAIDDVGAFIVPEMTAPSTPASGKVALYAKSDGLLYSKDDAGTETVVTGGSGGGGGSGDVVGPASATSNALVRFDSTTGKLVKNSNVTLADSGTALVFPSGAGGITANGNIVLTPTGGYIDTFYQLRASSGTSASSFTTGSVVVDGGVGVSGSIWSDATVNSRRLTAVTANGNTRGAAPIVAHQSITAVGNVGTGEDTLITTTLQGNTLNTNGDRLRIRATFIFAANTNNKTLKGKYGATTFYDSTALAINDGTAVIEAVITRTGAATQNISVTVLSSNATLPNGCNVTTAAETLSPGSVTLSFTGEATSNDDISERELVIEYLPAP